MSQDVLTTNRREPPAAGASPAAAPPWIRAQVGNWLEQAGMLAILAVLVVVSALAFIFSGGKSVGITRQAFFTLGNAAWPVVRDAHHRLIFQLTTPVWICVGCFLFFGFLLQRTTFGRNTLAIGGNEEAARLAGIPVARIKILIFVMQGIVAALAGMVLASRMTSGQPKSSDGLELQVISACVLGGVSLTGGI